MFFSLLCNYLRPSNNSRQLIFNINAVVLALIICKLLRKVKCIPEFEYFTVFLKTINIISKIKRSNVTDYASLNNHCMCKCSLFADNIVT